MNRNQYQNLIKILSQPTAPFYESFVFSAAVKFLDEYRVPFFADPHGNLVVGVGSQAAYRRLFSRRRTSPVRIYIAHMDHPGFHGVRWASEKRLEVKWYGGSPTKSVAGSHVWLATEDGAHGEGLLSGVSVAKHGYSIDRATIRIERFDYSGRRSAAKKVFGGFRFRAPVWRSGKRLYTKAADDLVGVFCVLETAKDLFAKGTSRSDIPFIGLLTRAEEVGFVGALAHFELGWYTHARRPLLCVSLEASRTLPGADVGKGPVVRLGDRRTVFDAVGLQGLTSIAEKVLPKRYQRRIMDGGACEGAAATAYGLPTIGLSLPLGNYHNEGFEGGQDCRRAGGPAPEFVHIDDIDGLLKLSHGIMDEKVEWKDPWRQTRERLLKNYRRLEHLL